MPQDIVRRARKSVQSFTEILTRLEQVLATLFNRLQSSGSPEWAQLFVTLIFDNDLLEFLIAAKALIDVVSCQLEGQDYPVRHFYEIVIGDSCENVRLCITDLKTFSPGSLPKHHFACQKS